LARPFGKAGEAELRRSLDDSMLPPESTTTSAVSRC